MQTISASLFQVSEVALFTARPMYWAVRPVCETAREHVEGVIKLCQWCLRLPESRLGVDPKGLVHIIRSMYARGGTKVDPDLDRLLNRVRSAKDMVPWPGDRHCFGNDDIQRIIGYLQNHGQGMKPGDYLWLDPEDAQWWTGKTLESLHEYAEAFRLIRNERQLFDFFIRHRCTVFAPLDGSALWEALQDLLSEVDRQEQEGMRRVLEYHGIGGQGDLTSKHPLFWSWRLIDFGVVGGNLLYQPTLVLWSAWPGSRRWAPVPPPEQETPATQAFSVQQAASMLEGFMWKKGEMAFSTARQLCGLGVAEPEFAGREARPPVFYYVAPAEPVERPESYEETYRSEIHTLVTRCLGSDDPFSSEVAWGVLEGDLVALRQERILQDAVRSWYLLLPIAHRQMAAHEVRAERERDIDFIVDKLTFVEFSIGHEARDIATDLDAVGTRLALWGGSLDAVSEAVSKAAALHPLLRPPERGPIQREVSELLALLHQWRTYLEKVHSDAAQILRNYQDYKDSTEDFLRRALTFSFPFAGLCSLVEALLDAYPYHYLQQPLSGFQAMISSLSSHITNTTEATDAILREAERGLRERQERATRRLSFILGILAILIGVPQFIPGAALIAENYPSGLSRVLSLPELEAAMRVLAVVFVVPLIYFLVEAAFHWIYHLFPHPDPFLTRVLQLRNLVSSAEDVLGGRPDRNRLERMDEEASRLLIWLWEALRREGAAQPLSRLRRILAHLKTSPESQGLVHQLRRLRYSITLFDLAPQRIPLPRSLCLFRYKSSDFHARSTVSDWEFQSSLRVAGFERQEIRQLGDWLSSLENQQAIKEMSAEEFVIKLQERGVSADPARRTPEGGGFHSDTVT